MVAGRSGRVYKLAMDMPDAESARSKSLNPYSDETDATIRIEDSTYDVDRIMANLRKRLVDGSAQRVTGVDRNDVVMSNHSAAVGPISKELGLVPGADDLTWQLFQAEAESRQNQVADQVRVANGLIGVAVTLIRRPLHQLARFYANQMGRKQQRVNDRLIHVAHMLIQRSDEDRGTIAALRVEIVKMEARLEELAGREHATDAELQKVNTSITSSQN